MLTPWYKAYHFRIKRTFILKNHMAQMCNTILSSNTLFHVQPIYSYLCFRKTFFFLFLVGTRG